ncbi:MAG TPA: efflux RND transporter periplasmic adaptor subunit [Phycisphaerales bacterium]|nr:efflux RND transporter periplasmic adaptor subunit [Phycisphaerales bacterium]HMP36486.1 efflux RND transporter periplasmic adaptor subunit [Phycisphaerales bacterium]
MTVPSDAPDLRALARRERATDAARIPRSNLIDGLATVPRPARRWTTRLLLPSAVVLTTFGIIAYAARDALRPRLEVHVAAAIPTGSTWSEPSPAGSLSAGGAGAGDADGAVAPRGATAPDGAPVTGPVLFQAPGWVEPAPFAIGVPALAEGVVREILALEGDRIEAGALVARLIDDEALLALRGAEAAFEERRCDLGVARAALATAESRVAVERIAAEELRDEVTRKRDFVAGGAVSEAEFRKLEIRLAGQEARVVTAEAVVDEARAALALADSRLGSARVARDEARLRLERMEVRSPAAGVVLSRLVEPGARVGSRGDADERFAHSMPSGGVVRIYDPEKLQVRVDVPLADSARIAPGTRAAVTVEALPEETFTGVVTRVVPEASIQRNTLQFKVLLDRPSPLLKPEMLARVRFHAESGASMPAEGRAGRAAAGGPLLLVPMSAIVPRGDSGGHAWVVDRAGDTPVARLREVGTAPSGVDGYVGVTRGLRITDRVVLEGPNGARLRDGARLRILGEGDGTAAATNDRVDPGARR